MESKFAAQFSINCIRIMIKRAHSCASDRPSSRLVMQRRCLWIKQSHTATEPERVVTTTALAMRAICYFAFSATHSLIKRPFLVVRPRHFSNPRQRTTCRDWRPLCSTFVYLRSWPFFCPAIYLPRLHKRFDDGSTRATRGFRQRWTSGRFASLRKLSIDT